MFDFCVLPNNSSASLELIGEKDGIYEYKFTCKASGETITVVTHTECINCFTVWNHTVDFDRQLRPEWFSSKCISSVLKGVPYHSLVGQDGNNVLAIVVSDVKNRLEIKTGLHEEDSTVTCKIVFNIPVKDGSYEAVIRLDTRSIPYYECIYSASDWWKNEYGYTCSYVPETAKMPMYSSWYSFHQMLTPEEIVKECKLAKKMGMDTIILDDGWQTDDVQRGYAFCGDWKPAKAKVGDMKQLAESVHTEGMKIMLWYNIAFMGEHAENSKQFEGMYMGEKVSGRYTLDPRYAKVREYLTDLFVTAVKDWNLDGLKIDFVDSFIRSENDVITDGMDFPVLEDAVEELIKSISENLYRINPEIMIEFRQNYMGPAMRKYANIFRVADCPDDSLRNRIGVINLRLTAAESAVHSDMLMWNYNEPVEIAAKQIINVLYSVPQISVRIERLNPEHYKMLEFYLSLWIKYRKLFIDTKIVPESPETNYSKVVSKTDDSMMCVLYSDNTLKLDCKDTVAVNGTSKDKLYVESEVSAEYTVYNCMGDVVSVGTLEKGLSLINVPVSGVVVLN